MTEIEVLPANAAPVFDNFDGLRVLEGQPMSLRGFAYDPDNPFYEPAVRLADGSVLQGEVVRYDDRTVTLRRLDTGGEVSLRWSLMSPFT